MNASKQKIKDAKRKLKKIIRDNKQWCLKELQNKVNLDLWGRSYKIVMEKIKRSYVPPLNCPELLSRDMTTLFSRKLEEPCVIKTGLNKQ